MARAFGGLGVTTGLVADRAALSGVVAGQQFFETDTNKTLVYTGSVWQELNTLQHSSSYLSATSSTQTDGASNANVIYTAASITLTSGTWLVQATLGLFNLTTTDSSQAALYNQTAASIIANSHGPVGFTSTTWYANFVTPQTLISVSSNTQVCPIGIRNGVSRLRVGASAATGLVNSGGSITAFKIRS